MKKLLAFTLTLLMLLSLFGCSKEEAQEEKIVTIYVVTEQKNYFNGELTSTANFEYDGQGRLTVWGYVRTGGSSCKTELTYDQAGNVTAARDTYLFNNGDEIATLQNMDLTYTNGLLTGMRVNKNGQCVNELKLSYNSKGQLVLVEYPLAEAAKGGPLWQSFEYDKYGRLTQETRCISMSAGPGSAQELYYVSRNCYIYDAQGRLTEQYLCSGQRLAPVSPKNVEEMELAVIPSSHYFFHYDKAGKLAYVGASEEDVYSGGSAEIYSDPDYIFDANGNLIRVHSGEGSWVEYTYQAIQVSESDARMHKALIHSGYGLMTQYAVNATADPLFFDICPVLLYYPMMRVEYVSHLVPYPHFNFIL